MSNQHEILDIHPIINNIIIYESDKLYGDLFYLHFIKLVKGRPLIPPIS